MSFIKKNVYLKLFGYLNFNTSFWCIYTTLKYHGLSFIFTNRFFLFTEDMPAGQTPHTVIVFAHGDLIDKVQAGDRINITGIYRATPLRVKAWQRGVKAVYKTHIDVIHFRKMDEKKLHQINDDDDVATLGMSEAVIENLKKLSEQPDIYLRLAQAIGKDIILFNVI